MHSLGIRLELGVGGGGADEVSNVWVYRLSGVWADRGNGVGVWGK